MPVPVAVGVLGWRGVSFRVLKDGIQTPSTRLQPGASRQNLRHRTASSARGASDVAATDSCTYDGRRVQEGLDSAGKRCCCCCTCARKTRIWCMWVYVVLCGLVNERPFVDVEACWPPLARTIVIVNTGCTRCHTY